MFSALKYTLVLLSITILSASYGYNKYINHVKEKELLIRKDERSIIEKEIREETQEVIARDKKTISDLKKKLDEAYKRLDKNSKEIKEEIKNSNTEKEINNSFQEVLICLEKAC